MSKAIASTLLVASILMGCASGTHPPPDSTARCSFHPELTSPSPDNLPPSVGPGLPDLQRNRIDSKEAYRSLWLKHRDLSREVANCLTVQAASQKPSPSGAPQSPLEARIERAKERLK